VELYPYSLIYLNGLDKESFTLIFDAALISNELGYFSTLKTDVGLNYKYKLRFHVPGKIPCRLQEQSAV
jgi:hypothetical protein